MKVQAKIVFGIGVGGYAHIPHCGRDVGVAQVRVGRVAVGSIGADWVQWDHLQKVSAVEESNGCCNGT